MHVQPPADLLSTKFIRVTRKRTGDIVEFDFAVGSPDIWVELIMPRASFEDFCATNSVVDLTGQEVPNAAFSERLSQVLSGQNLSEI